MTATPGDVARQIDVLGEYVLACELASRRVNAPGGVPAFNAAQGDVIREAVKLAALVEALTPGTMPPAWRDREVIPA
jgi:hypothetical protein